MTGAQGVIVKLVLDAVALLLSGLDALVPDLTLPYLEEVEDAVEWAGSKVAFVAPVLPVAELATVTAWIASTYLPCWFVFVVVRWVYAHIPVIGAGA